LPSRPAQRAPEPGCDCSAEAAPRRGAGHPEFVAGLRADDWALASPGPAHSLPPRGSRRMPPALPRSSYSNWDGVDAPLLALALPSLAPGLPSPAPALPSLPRALPSLAPAVPVSSSRPARARARPRETPLPAAPASPFPLTATPRPSADPSVPWQSARPRAALPPGLARPAPRAPGTCARVATRRRFRAR
jgi:hypothetical protein